MTYKIPPAVTASTPLAAKGAWTSGSTTALNNVWTYTPAGGDGQNWVDTVGGGTLPASPAAGNTTTPGRWVEEGEVNVGSFFAPLYNIVTAQTAAFTAAANTDYQADTTSGAFTVTLPGATTSTGNPTRVRVTNTAAPTVTNAATFAAAGSDTINLPSANLPLTVMPGESVELHCKVAGKWSLV